MQDKIFERQPKSMLHDFTHQGIEHKNIQTDDYNWVLIGIRPNYPTSQLSPLNPEWQEHVSGAVQFPFKQWREQWGTQAFSTS
jgi:hypothetical protein